MSSSRDGKSRSPNDGGNLRRPKRESESSEASSSSRASKQPKRDRSSSQAAPENKRRFDRYEIVHTRPADVTSKTGSQGQQIQLTTNYFRVKNTPSWRLYSYHVDFEPNIDSNRVRCGIMYEHNALFRGYLFDGMKLMTTVRLPEDLTSLTSKSKDGDVVKVTIKFVDIISMTDWKSLQVLNLILRRAMKGLKLQQVGRNHYDAQAKINLNEFNLQLWPGYQTSIRQHEHNILLCAEITHKVMRMESVYDILMKCTQISKDYQADFTRQVVGLTVLTDYNNKTYRINSIDFDHNPEMTFDYKKRNITLVDYYYEKYHIRIRDRKQPLLVSKTTDRNFGDGQTDTVLLIPELCRATGLTEDMRKNFRLMRGMSDYSRMNPDRRIDRLRAFNNRLQSTAESHKTLTDWQLELDKNLLEIKGRVLDPQKIVFADNSKVSAGDMADWTRYFRDNKMLTVPHRGLDRWAVIATNRQGRELRSFVQSLIQAGAGMNLRIQNPIEHIIYDDRNHSYMQAMEECSRQDPQLIMCLVPTNSAERYSAIKKMGCLERPIPTQVITSKLAGNQRGLMSAATKVAIQINCKLGYTPWMIDLPLSGLMTIGYDVVKSSRDRSKAYGALVATMDMKINATFYSTVMECNAHSALASNLWVMISKALHQYQEEHGGNLPARIIFYRESVGEGSLQQVYDHEVTNIVKNLEKEYATSVAKKPPMFAYIVVAKGVNARFFARGRNPPPGTVIDDVVTLPERYDFYLVSQAVRQGTVSPTNYNVLYSNIRLTPDQIQLLTYKMSHLYYNWSGTTRVPAVCQYAKKLATLVATCLYLAPQQVLEKKLFYL